eukprot:4311516-Pleurochrysis_carterae.AAC.4
MVRQRPSKCKSLGKLATPFVSQQRESNVATAKAPTPSSCSMSQRSGSRCESHVSLSPRAQVSQTR